MKRRSRAIDPDTRALRSADRALGATTPRMRPAALDYLRDKYLHRPPAWLKAHDLRIFGRTK